MGAGLPSSSPLVRFFLKGMGYVPINEHEVHNGHEDKTLFMLPDTAPGLGFCIHLALLASCCTFSNKLL